MISGGGQTRLDILCEKQGFGTICETLCTPKNFTRYSVVHRVKMGFPPSIAIHSGDTGWKEIVLFLHNAH